MKRLLFLTAYPNPETLKDGMVQRVKNVDDLFDDKPRMFLDIKIKSNFSKKVHHPTVQVTEYRLNAFLHFFLIWKLINKSDVVYLHSIYGMIWTVVQLFFYKKTICLDFHGVVPEENLVEQGKLHYYYFRIIEWIAARLATKAVYVSHFMAQHFEHKYPSMTRNCMVYPNYANIRQDHIPIQFNQNEGKEKTIFIYSGNLQGWQNIDEILTMISTYQAVPNYYFIILTGQPEAFKRKILKYKIPLDKIEINSVSYDEIDQYYAKAHYGFILRSDHIVNKVANPTKMIEYLLFGIIPIVKSANIGDFRSYPYEYLSIAEVDEHLAPKKSAINQSIAIKLLNTKEDLMTFIYE